VKRISIRLDRLNVATAPEQMNLPGLNFHALERFCSNPLRGPRQSSVLFKGGDFAHTDIVAALSAKREALQRRRGRKARGIACTATSEI
jgi:hypothetical protein